MILLLIAGAKLTPPPRNTDATTEPTVVYTVFCDTLPMLVLWSADITVLTLRGLNSIRTQEILEEQGDGRNHVRSDTPRILRVGVVGKDIMLLEGFMVCAMGSSKGY